MPAKPVMVRELESAGFTSVRPRWRNTPGPLVWCEAKLPGGELVAVLRQGPRTWHGWHANGASASAHSPAELAKMAGGLGDVIDTDAQLAAYGRHIDGAPREVYQRFPLGPSR